MAHPAGERPGDQSEKQNQDIRRTLLKRNTGHKFHGYVEAIGHSFARSLTQSTKKCARSTPAHEDTEMKNRNKPHPQGC